MIYLQNLTAAMRYRRTALYFVFALGALASCREYNIGVRSFYNLETDSYKVAQARIIQLYRNKTFETNSDSLTRLICRSIPGFPMDSVKNEWTPDGYRKYQLGATVKQDFVVFYPRSQTYYRSCLESQTECSGWQTFKKIDFLNSFFSSERQSSRTLWFFIPAAKLIIEAV